MTFLSMMTLQFKLKIAVYVNNKISTYNQTLDYMSIFPKFAKAICLFAGLMYCKPDCKHLFKLHFFTLGVYFDIQNTHNANAHTLI